MLRQSYLIRGPGSYNGIKNTGYKVMYGVILKIIFFIKLYIFALLLGIFLLILHLYLGGEIKIKKSIFYRKIMNNEPYYFSDYAADMPLAIYWTKINLKNPSYFLLFLTILFLYFIVKLYLIITVPIAFPFVLAYFIKNIYYKKEIKLNFKQSFNPTLYSLTILITIKLPIAINFKIIYFLFKAIYNKQKSTISFSLILNRMLGINITKIPFGMLINANNLTISLKEIKITKLKSKKKLRIPIIVINLGTVKINNSLYSNKNSYLASVEKLRIYFIKDKINFNPTNQLFPIKREVVQIFKNEFKEATALTGKGKLPGRHPLMIIMQDDAMRNGENEEDSFNRLIDGTLQTGKPLEHQKAFISGGYVDNKGKLRYSMSVYNEMLYNEAVSREVVNTYKKTENEKLSIVQKVLLYRLIEDNAGLNIQSKENSSVYKLSGNFFHENLYEYGKLTGNAGATMYAKRGIDDFNSNNFNSSEIDNYQMWLYQLEYDKHTGSDFKIDLYNNEESPIKKNNFKYGKNDN